MWYLYLDESGDLGFDFVNKQPSKYFTITILALRGSDVNRQLINAVKKTIRRKLNPKNKRKRIVEELKGTDTTLDIKKYFYNQIHDLKFVIYSITLNKKRVYQQLSENKSRVYNFVARQVLDQIPFEKNNGERVYFIVDRCKNKREIVDFNQYITKQLEGRLDPTTPLEISHKNSKEMPGIQAADLFAYGIFQKYEHRDHKWFDIFQTKIRFDQLYLA